ncbi:Hypothetical protein POVR1_LOCUS564 [uncultured virus]|nr:Hypothetical protein POVR1_LOCUS564 [uncultured virus]
MIYVLRLEQEKFYVGFSDRPHGKRLIDHLTGSGAKWTKKYKVCEELEHFPGTLADEDRVTLEWMLKKGWNNVRGGKWCQVKMDYPPQEFLDLQLKNSGVDGMICARCGRNTHRANQCYAKTHLNGNSLNPIYRKKSVTSKQKRASRLDDDVVSLMDNITSKSGSFDTYLQSEAIEHLGEKSVGGLINLRKLKNLKAHDVKFISSAAKLQPGEILEIVYLNQAHNFDHMTFNDIIVGITNLRVFKIQDVNIVEILLTDIISIAHEHNIICWDNMICQLTSGKSISIGIYSAACCRYMITYIEEMIRVMDSKAVTNNSSYRRLDTNEQNLNAPIQPNTYLVQPNTYPVQPNTYLVQRDAYLVQRDAYPIQQNTYPVQPNTYPIQRDAYPTSTNIQPVVISNQVAKSNNCFYEWETIPHQLAERPPFPKGCSSLRLAVDLSARDMKTLTQLFGFQAELIDTVYLSIALNYGSIHSNDLVVMMTDQGILRSENGITKSVNFKEIIDVQTVHNWMCWDQIIITYGDFQKVTLDIYETAACKYMSNLLQYRLGN